MNTSIKSLRQRTGLTQAKFAERLKIPSRTLQNWEIGHRECPLYVKELIDYYLTHEKLYRE